MYGTFRKAIIVSDLFFITLLTGFAFLTHGMLALCDRLMGGKS